MKPVEGQSKGAVGGDSVGDSLMQKSRVEITVPELGLPEVPITLSVWLLQPGGEVYQGDRVLEIFAGAATVDVGAPASGRLIQQLALEDDPVQTGQVVGIIEVSQP